ncbi:MULTISPECIES: class I SAM-dependent methyltransferase [Rhizobium]|uniref:SAM-dependent methyltransferase n=1 Tax=Rhizobium favelukesii TaxID=348824 RepID=W6R345_9HYPH|nr:MULTISPECIES: class I SAM-dependent methyltransferase [Rhizobium]MCS0461350.1 class I SAM-dependent methyltransferase [Rhizobium favelukesii]UFS82508.1 class I SAM-dependent methyltransferase [Rhizobium sp. T136]CDM55772.1 putative SAM-dependent methyltransferase [Rhizobium favelukesii]
MSHQCRFCSAPLTTVVADLGSTPWSNSFLPDAAAIAKERSFPLKVMVCAECFLVQTTENVPADAIFNADYAYLSSFSTSWLEHAKRYAEMMTEGFGLSAASTVVEVASNDGYLLQYFAAKGIQVLGVEPAANAAKIAQSRGVATKVAFFGRQTAQALVESGVRADVTAANNVLAHVPDIADFVSGFAILLKPDGVSTFEFPHLLTMIDGIQFDTIYHEHYSYMSLLAVERIFGACGLKVFDVEEIPTHGGSLRVFAQKAEGARAVTDRLLALRAKEEAFGLKEMATYERFGTRIEGVCEAFKAFLRQAKVAGKTVAAYGAAAKGNTFLNVCRVNADDIVFVVDRSDIKQGKLLPGSHIPVYAPSHIEAAKPDYLVILPWNLTDEIVKSNQYIRAWDGRFVVAIPTLRIL